MVFSGSTPKGGGKTAATQRITLELKLEPNRALDDLKEMVLHCFKVNKTEMSKTPSKPSSSDQPELENPKMSNNEVIHEVNV